MPELPFCLILRQDLAINPGWLWAGDLPTSQVLGLQVCATDSDLDLTGREGTGKERNGSVDYRQMQRGESSCLRWAEERELNGKY